jgi:hypothetical protein
MRVIKSRRIGWAGHVGSMAGKSFGRKARRKERSRTTQAEVGI